MFVRSDPLHGGSCPDATGGERQPGAGTAIGTLLDAAPRAGLDLPCRSGDADLWFAESPAELERAKALLTTQWWRQVSTAAGRADVLGRYATQFGDPGRAGERLPAWLAVTAEEVTRVAAELLRPDTRVTLVYTPPSSQQQSSQEERA